MIAKILTNGTITCTKTDLVHVLCQPWSIHQHHMNTKLLHLADLIPRVPISLYYLHPDRTIGNFELHTNAYMYIYIYSLTQCQVYKYM